MRIDTSRRISKRDLETPIGTFTDPFPYSFRLDHTIGEVRALLQSVEDQKPAEYFYVTDKENRLKGFITLTDLVYNSPETQLSQIVDTEVLKVYNDESLEKGLKFLSHHQLLIVPVVNRKNMLLGILEISPQSDESYPKKIHYKNFKEDVFQFIGFSIEHRKWDSHWVEYRHRMPWLLCNVVGGLVCAFISHVYKLTLEQFVILAFFIPLVLTLSESVSIQSMTLSLRFLHLRRVHWRQVWKRSMIETTSSFLLGCTSAILITCFYFAWSSNPMPIIGIASSIVLAMVVSALFGALFPIFLHVVRLDPKVAAGPVVLMIADILTIGIYLSLNTVILM
jgi:magnesium transporter